MGWLDLIPAAVSVGTTLWDMFDSSTDDMNTAYQHMFNVNRMNQNTDYQKLFDYWLGQQAHWAARSLVPLSTPEWQLQKDATEQMFDEKARQWEASGTKRGLTGGAVAEGLNQLEKGKLSSLENSLNQIMAGSEAKLWGTPPPSRNQVQTQTQYPPYLQDSGTSVSGLLMPLMMLSQGFGGGNASQSGSGTGQLNTSAAGWLMNQATGQNTGNIWSFLD